ncbi:MAG: PQQ-binding-like beta-propeller repeat protein [Myxococcales bacterium]|nr:PQQ-binding-like beta-propeller repeat protein [Myxococcales bacterium]
MVALDGAGEATLVDASAPLKDAFVDAPAGETETGSGDASDAGGDVTVVGDGGVLSNQATSYLMNPAHTNAVADPTIAPRLELAWTKTVLPGTATYPLIAGGLVYLFGNYGGVGGIQLVALDEATGVTRWGPVNFPDPSVKHNHAYDSGRIFVTDQTDGTVRAFDAATGAPLWVSTVSAYSDAPPTAYGGLLYLGGSGTVTAVDEKTGATVWTADIDQELTNSPAVTEEGVFVATGRCEDTFALDRHTGATIWQYTGGCGSTGTSVAVFAGRVWVQLVSGGGEIVLDEATGKLLSSYAGGAIPAFAGSNIETFSHQTLLAQDVSAGTNAWKFVGDGALYGDPIVAGGTVYIGSEKDRIYGVDQTTGVLTWQEQVGADSFPGIFVAGEGLLLSLGSDTVFAYRHVDVPDASVLDPAPDGGCPRSGCFEPAVTLSAEPGNGLAIDANRVYWTNASGDIRAIPKTGGQPTTLNSKAGTGPWGIAVDANNLYWAVPDVTETAVMKMPLSGGAAQALVSNNTIPQNVVVGPSQVYFSGVGGAVGSVPIAGGAPTFLGNGTDGLGALAIDATNLYFSTDVTYALPLGGGTATPIGPAAAALVSDGTYLYYVSNLIDDGVVGRVSVAGGTPTVLIDGRQGYIGGLAVDGDNVYWAEGSLTARDGAVAAMPKGGGQVTILAAGLMFAPRTVFPMTLAVDDTGIYFVSSSEIAAIPKRH